MALAYTNGALIRPFYFGGLLKAQIAFPSADFPSKYYYQDKLLPNPFLDSLGFMVPVGISIKPFGNNLEFFAELDIGGMMYTFQFPGYGFAGKYFFAVNGEMCVGLALKGISLFVGGGYNTQIGFTFDGGIGIRIEVGS